MVWMVALAALAGCRSESALQTAREQMVELIARRGVRDEAVLEAMRHFPRHELIPDPRCEQAYADHPVGIGFGQTISQPYMVAIMTEAAQVEPGDKVLEVGTGSGYQAALLAKVGAKVFTVEIVPELAERAARDLKRLGVRDVVIRAGDGYGGWPDEAPFDAIVVTAAPERVPEPLREQLKVGGRLVIPVGPGGFQTLEVHVRRAEGFEVRREFAVRFVPMTGQAQEGSPGASQ